MGPSPVWSVPTASVFHWREWDQEFVVYHEQSGDTHRLNSTGAHVLRLLIRKSMTAAELTSEVAGTLALAEGADPASTLRELLERLYDLGLIEPRYDDPADTGAADSR